MIKRIITFLWLCSINSIELAEIIHALAQRQANGRGNLRPYDNAKKLVKSLPFAKDYGN